MKYAEQEKRIETNNFYIWGNVLRWDTSMIQLSNISMITKANYGLMTFPFWSLVLITGGIALHNISAVISVIGSLAGLGWIAFWYFKNENLKKLILLTIVLNSGERI